MKIGIVEFQYHHIFLLTLIRIFKKLGCHIEVFTTRAIKKQVMFYLKEDGEKEIIWHFKDDFSSLKEFFQFVNKRSANFDIIFYNTLQGRTFPVYFDYFRSLRPRCKSILVAGRTVQWFELPIKAILFSRKKLFKQRVDLFLMQWIRRIMLSRFNGIVVHTEPYMKYAKSFKYKRPIFLVPHALKKSIQSSETEKSGDKVSFVVSGAVADYRRDYETLLDAFEILERKYFKRIDLTLLGRAQSIYAKGIIDRCESLRKNGASINYFTDWVPEKVWHETMINCDACICPIKLENYKYGGYTSGIVDAIQYGKPLICPRGYDILRDLKEITLFYKDKDELAKVIEENFLINNSQAMQLHRVAADNSEKFSVDIWAKKVSSDLLSLL